MISFLFLIDRCVVDLMGERLSRSQQECNRLARTIADLESSQAKLRHQLESFNSGEYKVIIHPIKLI